MEPPLSGVNQPPANLYHRSRNAQIAALSIVMAGLDPAIHASMSSLLNRQDTKDAKEVGFDLGVFAPWRRSSAGPRLLISSAVEGRGKPPVGLPVDG